jgi:tetratricopeptide (TPR) repeat protein
MKMTANSGDFERAIQFHQGGRLAEAENLYRHILQTEPQRADVWWNLGLACFTSGNLAEAAASLRRAVKADPHHAGAYGDLGAVLAQQGNLSEAETALRESVRLRPDQFDAFTNLGMVLAEQRKLNEAVEAYRKAIQLNPRYGEAYRHLGLALSALGNYTEAVSCYQEAQRLATSVAASATPASVGVRARSREPRPNEETATLPPSEHALVEATRYNRQAIEFAQQGRLDESVHAFQHALRLRPDFPEAHSNLGNVYLYQENLEEAVASYERALKLQPDFATAHSNLGHCLSMLKRHEESEAHCRRAVQLFPDGADAFNNLGNALRGQSKHEEARDAYLEALRRNPDFAEAHLNIGYAWMDLHQPEEAAYACREAIRCKPNHGKAYHLLASALVDAGNLPDAEINIKHALRLNADDPEALVCLGVSLYEQGKAQEALAVFEEAIRQKPDYPDPHWGRGLVLLQLGRFEEGWPEYEWRWHCHPFTPRPFPHPRWDGAPLGGRRILIHAEQGLGDVLQFIRYAPLVKARGGHVILECQERLFPMLRSCAGIDQLAPGGQPLPSFEVQIALLSLPLVFGTTLASIPSETPYLAADERLVEQWRQKVADLPGFKIGIGWQGNPQIHQDLWRSFPLVHFAALGRLPGATLVSLQKGPGTEQIPHVADLFPLTDWSDRLDTEVGAFMDTAAVMKNLDLVITSDTATAHLAGALGVPVWVALPYAADFRWLLEREDSPWYPSMRLFRQRQPWNWGDVFQRITAEAEKLVPTTV